ADGRMRFEIMGKALFNKKPHSRSTWRQTLRSSLRRFGLRGDLTKFACLHHPRSRRLGDWRPVAPFHVGGLGLYKSIQRVTKPKVKKVTAVTDAPQPVLTS